MRTNTGSKELKVKCISLLLELYTLKIYHSWHIWELVTCMLYAMGLAGDSCSIQHSIHFWGTNCISKTFQLICFILFLAAFLEKFWSPCKRGVSSTLILIQVYCLFCMVLVQVSRRQQQQDKQISVHSSLKEECTEWLYLNITLTSVREALAQPGGRTLVR